ncbi:hypothetical protein [Methylocaldum sp.]|uniref:DMT family transporter n=1 Tax=Methylocaldum sp. TaxID=1969727 RepID=UPI002D2CAB5B|nr:hypothetical protein [Methylocaldum sp.]HYE37790.1 hypothetical protein [Methylocaldum sp.]
MKLNAVLGSLSKMISLIKPLFLILYVALSLFGLYKLKATAFGLSIGYIVGFLAYASGFGLWLIILKLYPLSVAFPLAAGSLIFGTQIVGVYVLREQFDSAKIMGVVLILAGIVTLAISDMVGKNE